MTRRVLGVAFAVLLAVPCAASGAGVSRAGPWLVDDQGRVVIAHGVNIVRKSAPFYPSRFTEADARFLADEGFTVARVGFIWEAVEPQPGRYDDAYIARIAQLDDLLARFGIRTLVDFHHDLWSRKTGGDGAPDWATLGATQDDSFMHFWHDDPAPDGVGIQTHFVEAWRHVARALRAHDNVLGFDPLNEPYPGSDHPPPCSDFSPCPDFESGPLAAFHRRVIAAIRGEGAQQPVWPEGIAMNGVDRPALPRFSDPQTAYQFHYYCTVGQVAPAQSDPVSAAACAQPEQRGLGTFVQYAKDLGVPAILGEFSCSDLNADNAQIVDFIGRALLSWTVWAYYTARDDPANCGGQGLLADDAQGGSEANAKQAKLDALVVPHPQAIAGTPRSYDYDRGTRVMGLTYEAASGQTRIFVPARVYPHGYRTEVTGGAAISAPTAPWVVVSPDRAGAPVTVRISPATGSTTQRPSEVPAAQAAASPRVCSSRRVVVVHLRRRGVRSVVAYVDGRRAVSLRGRRTLVRVSLAGLRAGLVRVRVVVRTSRGTVALDRRFRTCAR